MSNTIFVDGRDMTDSIVNALIVHNYNVEEISESYGLKPSELYSFLNGNDVIVEKEAYI